MDSVETALAQLKLGGMIVVIDDESRENEGDLICAASLITPEHINFMSKHGRGLICLSLPKTQIKRLGLPLMRRIDGPSDPFGTAFTYSIDAANGITTGISAADRALTIKIAASPNASPSDLSIPGHIFPLEAKPGGVLERRGHTEAAVDLSRLAGCDTGGVICEIMSDDGSMMRTTELKHFAAKHNLPIITMQQIVEYRLQYEGKSSCQATLPTPTGTFIQKVYQDGSGKEHVLLILGDVMTDQQASPPLVRIHSECFTGDIFQSLRCDCGSQLKQSIELISAEGRGIIIYLRQEGRGIGLMEKIRAYALQDQGLDTVEANHALGHAADLRSYEMALQMLHDMGIGQVRLLTNNPSKARALKIHGIKVTRVPLIIKPGPFNTLYQQTKATKLGHLIPINDHTMENKINATET